MADLIAVVFWVVMLLGPHVVQKMRQRRGEPSREPTEAWEQDEPWVLDIPPEDDL